MDSLLLVRHALAGSNRDGLASGAVPGEGLTVEGREQAERLAALLASQEIDLGVATRLRRTQETLELALEGRNVPVLIVPELDEIDFGSFDGGLLETYRSWAAAESPVAVPPGGGESRAEAAARIARGVRALLARPEPVALVVGHALALRYVLDAALGLVPAPRLTPLEHAVPARLSGAEAEAAAALLEGWSAAPRFRGS